MPSDASGEVSGSETYTYVERVEDKEQYSCVLDWKFSGESVAEPICTTCLFEVRLFAELQTESINDGTCEGLLDSTFVYALDENYKEEGMALLYRELDQTDFTPFIQKKDQTEDFAADLQFTDNTLEYRGGYYQYLLP